MADDATAEKTHSRAELRALLGELLQKPDEAGQIEKDIEEKFTQDKAVMVLDLSGFSKTTVDRGIVSFLLMIYQMELLATPSVEGHGGTVVKQEADNLFCLFDGVDDALAASIEIRERLNTVNVVLPDDRDLYAAIGIGYGPVLNIGDEDVWGSEVNLASKLGEDIGELGQILLTEAASSQLDSADEAKLKRNTVSVSGLELNYYEVGS